MGRWKVRPDTDHAMIERDQEKVARFTEPLPGCLEAAVAPLYGPEMSAADQEAFGASADRWLIFVSLARMIQASSELSGLISISFGFSRSNA